MKLLRAHIANFGKFSNKSFEFDAGLNNFVYENGWGKSTLAAFVKAIFYGMDASNSKDINKNERLKYFPWQGGTYGGSIDFLVDGKEYSVARTFDKKKGGDTFELRDLKTNKSSNAWSQNIGEELFGVNKETYSRSVYVTLGETPVGSVDICARLNNLIEANDISNYDKASDSLHDKKKAIKADRGEGGKLFDLERQAASDKEALRTIEAKVLANERLEQKLSEVQKELGTLVKERKKVFDERSVAIKFELKLRYEQLKKDENSAKENKARLETFFNGKIPDGVILKRIDDATRNLAALEDNLKKEAVTQSEKDDYEELKNYFQGDVPTKSQLDECIKLNADYQTQKQKIAERKLTLAEEAEFSSLQEKFEGKGVSAPLIEKHIKAFSDTQNLKSQIQLLTQEALNAQTHLQTLRSQKKPNFTRIALFCFSAGAVVLSAALAFLFKNALFLSGAVVAFATFIAGILSKQKKVDCEAFEQKLNETLGQKEELLKECAQKEGECKSFVSLFSKEEDCLLALNKLSNEFDHYEKLLEKAKAFDEWLLSQTPSPKEREDALRAFARRYCKTDDILQIAMDVQALNEKCSALQRLKAKIDKNALDTADYGDQRKNLENILLQYNCEKTLSLSEQVQVLHDTLSNIESAKSLIAENRKKLFDFEKEHEKDLPLFETLKKPKKTEDELKGEEVKLTATIDDKNKLLSDYKKQLDENLTFTETKADVESSLEHSVLQKKELENEYTILSKTLDFLSKAKEKLDANYSDPMKNSFSKYIKMLGGKLQLSIDTDLKVTVSEEGLPHSGDSLSEGYKDLVNFCARMALVDSLFKENKPPLVLDDPFVNLDDEKVLLALDAIKKISRDNQVLYFACHKSRTGEQGSKKG